MSIVIRHRRQPQELPDVDDFEIVDVSVPVPTGNNIKVQSIYLSLDPGLRSKIRDIPDDAIKHQTISAYALGRVMDPGMTNLSVGQLVRGKWGWAQEALVPSPDLEIVDEQSDIDPADELGVLGMPGMVAYVGLLDFGQPQPGETLYVSAAAGAIGSMVGQIGKILGCRVIGSAGTNEKVTRLIALGFDDAFNYRVTDPEDALKKLAPNGVDVFFDNVGGPQLQAALDSMALYGRIVCCGSISTYNGPPSGLPLYGLRQMVTNRLRMQGFVIWDHYDRSADQRSDMLQWIRSGALEPLRAVTEIGRASCRE